VQFVLALPAGLLRHTGGGWLGSLLGVAPVTPWREKHGTLSLTPDLALAASGTVTIETALLGTPMVTYYRVTGFSWLMGKFLVDVPFYSMVNLVADERLFRN